MRRWSALIGAAVVVLASCGSDSPSGEPAESASPTSDPPPVTVASSDAPTTIAAPATEPTASEPVSTEPANDETDVEAADRPDPCSVWTAADIEAATGLAFGEGVYNEALSVSGQEICDWITTGDALANAQVLVLAPGLDHAFLRSGTEVSAPPVTDLDITGAEAAHISGDGRILGIDLGGGVILQLAYIPPRGVTDTGDQLIQLANAAIANLA
jgi:hypothetical protein